MPAVDEVCIAAGVEYEKNDDLRRTDIAKLREWLQTQPHLPNIPEKTLSRFHHSCYYDLARTKDCIEMNYTFRASTPELFANRDVSRPELMQAIDTMYNMAMPDKDPRGYRIFYNALKDPDPSKFLYAETNKLLMMTIDACVEKNGPEEGVVVVYNMRGAKLGHLTRCSLTIMKRYTQFSQDANAIRLKEIHVINAVSWIDKLMILLKPFMKKELFNLFHFYSSDYDSLFDHIPRECLPKDIGGTQQSIDVLDAQNTELLASMRDMFAEDDKLKVDESKREKKKKRAQVEIETEFQKLEID